MTLRNDVDRLVNMTDVVLKLHEAITIMNRTQGTVRAELASEDDLRFVFFYPGDPPHQFVWDWHVYESKLTRGQDAAIQSRFRRLQDREDDDARQPRCPYCGALREGGAERD